MYDSIKVATQSEVTVAFVRLAGQMVTKNLTAVHFKPWKA
jgi:hypothetical protein